MSAGRFGPLSRILPALAAGMGRIIPSCCALCAGGSRDALCDACRARYFGDEAGSGRRCACCGLPLGAMQADGDRLCGGCLRHPPSFDATVVVADYAAPADQLVLALKFGGRLALAPLFASMLSEAAAGLGEQDRPQLLTAVPIGAARLAERGFNQAVEIAGPLARALGIPLDARLALRHRETRPQSVLHPDERRSNVRGAFAVPPQAALRMRGRHVGVVDDVMTTGETLNELAATFKRHGAARVTNFVFARTVAK